jgi:hypothetical protein
MQMHYDAKYHLDTYPVGIATQNPELRKRFLGKAENLVTFFTFLAEDVREYLAEMGFRNLDEIIGRFDLLERNHDADHWKTKNLDLKKMLKLPVEAAKNMLLAENKLNNVISGNIKLKKQSRWHRSNFNR